EGGRRAVEAKIFLYGAAFAGDEAPVGCEGLGETAHDKIDLAEHVLDSDVPAAVFAKAAQIVRNVNHQGRIEFVAKALKRGQIRRVRVHGEQAFGDDQNAVLFVFRPDFAEDIPAILIIEVAEQMNVVGGGVRALLQAGMRQHVDRK